MIKLPEYWLQCQDFSLKKSDQNNFAQLFSHAIEQEGIANIQYHSTAPKWQFLNYLVESENIVLHGSGNRNIILFEPRKADDITEFGNQKAVFAAADGVWPMFFAIIDRDNHPMVISNACIQFVEDREPISKPYYMFSISQGILEKNPWRKGVVYLLPSDTFVEQQTMQFQGHTVRIKQQASLVPVKPLAKIEVSPEDFPFLTQVREHDDTRMDEYAKAMQTGGAWPSLI